MHILRHATAKLRRDAAESILRRLEGQEDKGLGRGAEAIGV